MLFYPIYYSHRYGGLPENLDRAEQRVARLNRIYVDLYAPWIALARSGLSEAEAWVCIERDIKNSQAVLFDLDGGAWSPGMLRELELAVKYGKHIEIIP
jgi:hypothetical protein